MAPAMRGLLIALSLVLVACGTPTQQEPRVDRQADRLGDDGSSTDDSSATSLPRFAGKPQEMDQALSQVTSLVEATSHTVASGAEVSPAGDNGATRPCETDKDLVYASYGVEIRLQDDGSKLFDSAVSYWEDNGYEVVVRDAGSDAPSAYLNFGDFAFQMYVNSLSKLAFIGGSTPCYSPPT